MTHEIMPFGILMSAIHKSSGSINYYMEEKDNIKQRSATVNSFKAKERQMHSLQPSALVGTEMNH